MFNGTRDYTCNSGVDLSRRVQRLDDGLVARNLDDDGLRRAVLRIVEANAVTPGRELNAKRRVVHVTAVNRDARPGARVDLDGKEALWAPGWRR